MATAKLSMAECRQLEKYLRYLVYKSTQVIVQSRQGEKISVPSKLVSTGVDWFNLTIRDLPEVNTEVRRVYPSKENVLGGGDTVCIEIVLRHSSLEGSASPTQLETWYMRMNPTADPSLRVSFSMYSRFGTFIKSLFLLSRSLPTYRLSRQLPKDLGAAQICYRVYIGDPVFNMGPLYRCRSVGTVPTPIGTVTMTVAYRSNVTFDVLKECSIPGGLELAEDHFANKSGIITPSTSVHLPCCPVVAASSAAASATDDHSDNASELSLPVLSPSTPESKKTSPMHSQDVSCATETKSESQLPGKGEPASVDSLTGSHQNKPASDEFVVVNVKKNVKAEAAGNTLEARAGDAHRELDKFYEECRAAPVLNMFEHTQSDGTIQDFLSSVNVQLAQFEASAKEFDDFINSFPES